VSFCCLSFTLNVLLFLVMLNVVWLNVVAPPEWFDNWKWHMCSTKVHKNGGNIFAIYSLSCQVFNWESKFWFRNNLWQYILIWYKLISNPDEIIPKKYSRWKSMLGIESSKHVTMHSKYLTIPSDTYLYFDQSRPKTVWVKYE